MTAAGGILAIGTVNVTIQCNNCGALSRIRWYDPDGNRLVDPDAHNGYVPGTPYYTRVDGVDDNIILVIPTFTDSYDGKYTCGERVSQGQLPGVPNATVVLTISSKLMIHIYTH